MNPSPSLTPAKRVRGAIFGALVGDALGVPVEFSSRAERDAAPVHGMQAWGMHHQPAGTWSDDGALLLCTAESVMDGFSPGRLGASYVKWMRSGHWAARGEAFDIGNATLRSLERLGDGIPLEEAGATGEGENGNGSLMRILPIALRFHGTPSAQMTQHAAVASSITHAHRRSKLACGFYCLVAGALLKGASLSEAYRFAISEFEPLVCEIPREKAAFARILSGMLPELAREEIRSSGYVIDTLEAALWCVFRYSDFPEAVLAAVNLGEDTDTTGCVTGGLAGLIHGFDAIPPDWVAALPRRTDLDGLLECFVRACLPQASI